MSTARIDLVQPPKEREDDDLYPYCDGGPMAESDLHAEEMTYAYTSLQHWLQGRPDAYVSLDTFLYYEEGNPSAVVSPDLYVVFGSHKAPRRSYQVWREGGRLPSFVLEITSQSTRRLDIPPPPPRPHNIMRPRARSQRRPSQNKYLIYEQVLGVAEYFLFDPTGDYLEPRLQGFRLDGGRYAPIASEAEPLPNLALENQPTRWLYSEQLGLALGYAGRHLRCYNPVSGAPLLRAGEAFEALAMETAAHAAVQEALAAETMARAQADRRAAMAAQARAESEAELARLRAELEALRNNSSPTP